MPCHQLGRMLLTAHRSLHRSLEARQALAALTSSSLLNTRNYSNPAASSEASNSTHLALEALSSTGLSSFIAQPLEPISQFLSPLVLGSSVWELVHSSTGLPWWASIPLTTFALRTAMLPFTLKAKSAALNWLLMQQATQTASNLLEQLQQQQAAAASSASSTPKQQYLNAPQPLKQPSRLRLTRMYYKYYRKQHKTTSLWWFIANGVIQVEVFVLMSAALRQMAYSQWPGLTSEGLWWFTDLTQPSVVWGTWVCPYGVAGVLLPLGLTALYLKTIEKTPLASRSPGMKLLLDAGSLPYFVGSSLVPQATLLYWAGNTVFFYCLQAVLQSTMVAKAVGLPALLLPTPQGLKEGRERAAHEAEETHTLICGSEDAGFLRFLASNYISQGRHQQALQCLQRLTVLAPGDVGAFTGLGKTAAELQQWVVAAAAYERAAELHAALGDVEDQATDLVLAGKHWINAAIEAKQMQIATADSKSKTSGMPSSDSSSGSSDSSNSAPLSIFNSQKSSAVEQASKQQEYVQSALSVLQTAINLQSQAGQEGQYFLAIAQAAAGQRAEALSSSHTYWSQACSNAVMDPLAKSNAAAKLLPVLAHLCKHHHTRGDCESLLSAAVLATEVAKAGWDRQSQEELQETLGAAAQAATQYGRFAYAEQVKQLQQTLSHLVSEQTKFRGLRHSG